ncbi:hypothetical protein [Leptolyngbya iicbica]|uniref:Uncharacterized protein n=2 Tax=Cyanophyceae TaxID=3028117 RepID=A0A4Q7EHA5_9CYAN|nr:hypothetical protein [Leptolyngbya sp. LK]RZM82476.1 hypothetical protein DYY88_04340 [Leptolyngbya sp. LK]
MSAMLLLLLFFLGVLLSFIGGIIGVVDAFRVSTLWGVLALLVPFALLVFCIKFWRERKWARNSLIMSLLGLLAMVLPIPLGGGLAALTARNSLEQQDDDFVIEGDGVEVPSDAVVVPDSATEGETPTGEGEAELFEEAMLPGLPTAAEIARAELLPSTDPNERFNEINKERNDPYAFVPIPPPPAAPPPAPENGGTSPENQPNAGGGGGGISPTQPGGGQNNNGTTTPPTELPELPEPTVVASQVQVTGVARVNGESFAIVKAPNEPTSRYVRVGDRIANGTVLVKRIENPAGSAPVVVLEERGQEIALPVGSNVSPDGAPGDDGGSTAAVAAVPLLPPAQPVSSFQ